ncbi:MAG: chemotaxis protein CheB [Roseinatronobacter sp.]
MRDSASPDAASPRPVETVVALGASAGGLEALDRFFSAIDPKLDAAFVVIQHLAPTHKTMMDSLLARNTAMQVKVASEGDMLEAGHVYVIPSGTTMTLHDKRLRLDPRPITGLTFPINSFFHSLRSAGCDRIIGVILSGTGSDGSEGLNSVVEAGGWALVQSPASASFDGMPLNALATGLAHETGTPEELAHFIEKVVEEKRAPGLIKIANVEDEPISETLARIGALIAIDLTSYKPHTLVRRLERRMLATGHREVRGYLEHLQTAQDETERLRREMMIPVTSFFRDKDAFDELALKVIKPDLLALESQGSAPYRVWSIGCSTGPEAYSLAILVLEAIRELDLDIEPKIFATDIEPSYLAQASSGIYPARMLQALDPDLRDRYFTQVEDDNYQVTTRLRRAIVFSRHDVLSDPPFLNINLITCRNMIIYLQAEPQERALRRMLFGLKASGTLFMGGSEAPGKLAPLLDTVSARNKIFRLRGELRHLSAEDFLLTAAQRRPVPSYQKHPTAISPLSDATQALAPSTTCLIKAFVPPAVVIDANREIRHVYGDVLPFLRLRPGDASLDLISLLPFKVAAILSTLIFSALRDRTLTKSVILHPDDEDEFGFDLPVRIEIRPVPVPGQDAPGQLIVSFEKLHIPHAQVLDGGSQDLASLTASRAAELETELDQVRATLKTTIEELGSANEELQAGNEELMASNEELQSTNEELQSVNEELHTVNAELQEKILQLNEAYADLEGLSRAARIPLIFLDGFGRITRFSAQATEIFRLRDHDIGRPLMDITHTLDGFDFENAITQAQTSGTTSRQEVLDRENRSWLITIQPFVGRSSEESRMVLSFIDVSSVQAMRYLQSVIDAAPQNMAVLDNTGRIKLVNEAWQQFALENGGHKALAQGQNVNYLRTLENAAAQDSNARDALDGLRKLLAGEISQFSLIYPCHSPKQKRWFLMHASPMRDGGCVVTHLDISRLDIPTNEESTV